MAAVADHDLRAGGLVRHPHVRAAGTRSGTCRGQVCPSPGRSPLHRGGDGRVTAPRRTGGLLQRALVRPLIRPVYDLAYDPDGRLWSMRLRRAF